MQPRIQLPISANILFLSYAARSLLGVRLRYRYRLYPTPAQRLALARAFGCARVVYNDGLRLREDAYKAGLPFIGDTELQHQVLTLAKRTPQRAWLGEVPVRWSRPLPADPSSVTVTLDGAGRYHVSFVMDVQIARPPNADTAVGVDLGLTAFAVLSSGEKVDNPSWLRRREKALRRFQRNMARRRTGSRNRDKARRRVARLHAQVADARRDFHHQLSTRLIREHRTVAVETLNIAGLGRSNLAKSIYDAGWSAFVETLEYKARLNGRTLIKVDPWLPSSQVCSRCGRRDGPKPLKVRSWTGPNCGAVHDRDLNAARNILAAGLAVAACGPGVRPGASRPVGDEAGTAPAGAV